MKSKVPSFEDLESQVQEEYNRVARFIRRDPHLDHNNHAQQNLLLRRAFDNAVCTILDLHEIVGLEYADLSHRLRSKLGQLGGQTAAVNRKKVRAR